MIIGGGSNLMLDSKAVASVVVTADNQYILYIRTDFQENLGIWAFRQHLQGFPTELAVMLYFKKTYPQGQIIPFVDLTGHDHM